MYLIYLFTERIFSFYGLVFLDHPRTIYYIFIYYIERYRKGITFARILCYQLLIYPGTPVKKLEKIPF